jgi:hypothetical protein
MGFGMGLPISFAQTLSRVFPSTAPDGAMRAFAGNTAAAALDRGATEQHTDGHTGNGQDYDDEAREVQHYLPAYSD